MATRVVTALFLCLLLIAPAAAITVRFDTNVGNIDLLLNTTNPNLKPQVDNILAYIDAGRYEHVVLNRASDGVAGDPTDDFVLQFGGFTLATEQFSSFDAFSPVEAFDPVFVDFNNDGVIDFDTSDLTNTRGTVSLALSNSPNTGTSSFFVNLGDNSGLDAQGFVPFANVVDMSTVDYILRLNQVSDPNGGLASSDIPVIDEDNLLVFVERAYCLDCDAMAPMALLAESLVAESGDESSKVGSPAASAAASTVASASTSSDGLQVASVPEPPALVLAVGAFMVWTIIKGPRRY
jgi:cyclophilin family peptidyl-prolyl cis-trans isomerase